MFDEDFKCLKRSAIVMIPKQPFFDWLLRHDAEMVIDDALKTGNIYLLPDYETTEQMEKWLRKNFDELFEEELHGWYTDQAMWPPKRNFKMFVEWFSYSLYPVILDTQQGPIEKL